MTLANLLLLVVANIAAVAYFRSRRPWIGLILLIMVWAAVDAAVVSRYVLGRPEWEAELLFAVMQVVAAAATIRLAVLLWWRLLPRQRARREQIYRLGLVDFLADDLPAARRRFTLLARWDPWDRPIDSALAMIDDVRREPGSILPGSEE
jgi:hypothetical protein